MTSELHSTAEIRWQPCTSVDDFRIAFDGQDSMATVHVTVDDFIIAFDGQDSMATVRASPWIVDGFRIAFDGQDSMATVHVTADDFRTAFNGYRAHHRGSWMTSETHSTAKISTATVRITVDCG